MLRTLTLSSGLALFCMVSVAIAEEPHRDAPALRELLASATDAKLRDGKFDEATGHRLGDLTKEITDKELRAEVEKLLPSIEAAAQRSARDHALLAEINRLGGKATLEVVAPERLR